MHKVTIIIATLVGIYYLTDKYMFDEEQLL